MSLDCRRTIQTRSESESATGVPDPVIQTGSDVQTDRVNIGTANGPADSRDTPPSSDSGVHSLGEQWENMSTNSMDMESVQNEKPSYGGDTSQLVIKNSRPPNTEEGVRVDCPWTDCALERKSDDISSVAKQREDREVEFNNLTICESEHSIVYSGTDSRNSDIAAMSDFSDDEDETQVEFRPGPRTGSDRDDSIEEESSLCDRPITNTVTAGDGRDSLDPNDTEYWTKFRRLTRQAFLLDDDCLSDSNYPDAVKEVVRRSRLTIMALNEYDAPPFEQGTDGGTPGCSDSEDIMESDGSEGGDSEVGDHRPYEMRTYTPPLSKKRGRRYASLRKCETDVDDYFVETSDEERWHYCTDRRRNDDEDTSSQSMSTDDDSDDDFFQNNEWPIPENTVIPRKAADNVNRTVRNGNNNRAQCSAPENENDTTSDENSGPVDRPFTKLKNSGGRD